MRRLRTIATVTAVAAVAAVPVTLLAAPHHHDQPLRVAVLERHPDGGVPKVRTVSASSRDEATALIAKLRKDPNVVAADIDGKAHAFASDPLRSEQWALDRLDADKAWTYGTGTGQVVAVVDTGVEATHPDLAGSVLPGYDFVDKDTDPSDGNGHGTHVAGIIAAHAGNGIGVAGLAPGAKVLPVRVLNNAGEGDHADIAAGIIWSTDHNATVINLSLGGPDNSSVLQSAIGYALAKGVVVVAAAGNSYFDGNPVMYPAAYPNVVAVTATASGDSRAIFSETGSYVAVAAPGLSILSTFPGGGYTTMSGTSMASPYVAASAALVRQSHPEMTGAQVASRLRSSAQDLGSPGRDNEFGAGMADPVAARTDGKPRQAPPSPAMPGLPTLPTLPTLPIPALPSAPALPVPTLPHLPALPPLPMPTLPALPAPGMGPALSAAAAATPPQVTYGRTATVAVAVPGTRAGVVVVLMSRQSGSVATTAVGRATTDRNGKVAFTVSPAVTSSYTAVVATGPAAGRSSNEVVVQVSRVVTTNQARTGADVRITGTVAPAVGVEVRLERLSNNVWTSLASTRTDGSGAFSFTQRRGSSSALHRVVVPGSSGYTTSTSSVLTVHP